MNALPSKQELLAYQARWMRRAGAAAVAGAFIVTAATVLQRAGLNVPSGNSDADQLAFTHAHSARLILSSVIQGVGFSLSWPRCSSFSGRRRAEPSEFAER